MTVTELSAELASRGLLADGQELKADPGLQNASPWYVQVMMGVCAWFAGLFLLGFVVASLSEFLFRGDDNWGALLVLGVLACGGATALYAAISETSSFGSQFALAMSYAGQIAITIGVGGISSVRAAVWATLVVQVALTLLVRNRLHRFLTSLAAVIAWALASHEFLFGEVPGVSFWSSRQETYQMSAVSVLLWIVVWAPVAYAAWWLVRNEAQWMAEGHETLLRPVTQGLIAGLSIAPLATHPAAFWMSMGVGPSGILKDGSSGVTALWPLLAIVLALLAMALAFTVRNRPLIGLAIVFGLLEVSCFYYVLGTTLLLKSIVMVALGVALMAAARWLATEAK